MQTGSQRCLSDRTDSPHSPAIPAFSMAAESLPVHSSPLWTGVSTSSFYKADETSIGFPEIQRSKADSVLGRLSNHWEDQTSSRECLSGDQTTAGEFGICGKLGKVPAKGRSEVGISGICHRLGFHDNLLTIQESEGNQTEMLSTLENQGDNSSTVVSDNWNASGNKPSSTSGTPSLSVSAGSEDRRTSPPPLIRVYSDSEPSEFPGSAMVDYLPNGEQWEADPTASPRPDYRVRCIQYGMGGLLQQSPDRRSVVSQGDSSAHQCQRDASSISGRSDICQRQARSPCSAEGRQYNCNVLHQSQGGYALPSSDESHLGDVELVPTEKDFSVSGAPTGQTECCSRSRIEKSGGQFGMETRSKCVSTGDVSSRTMSDRSVCLKAYSTTSGLHKLETRPGIDGYGCTEPELVDSEVLRLPTFLSHWKVPSQSKAGEGSRVGTDSPSLANTTVVPCADVNDSSPTNVSAQHIKSFAQPTQRSSSSCPSRVPETSRMACIRNSLQNQGISKEASELILASWRHNTESAYSCNWRRWETWCQERNYNPLGATIGQILEFLSSEFAGGKQYRTLNSYRSAISMTHPPIDGVVVGKHPIVSRFMRGVFNSRPPQPRYTFTWDVSRVLNHIRVLGSNDTLSLKKLTYKLATILALANASRSSEIHALDVSYMKVSQVGVTFTLGDLTKTSRPGKLRSLFYPVLEQDRILCPVNTLNEYLLRTKKYRLSGRSQSRLFLTVVKPFKPAHKSSIARWIKTLIREAGVDDHFGAHSIRGASTTAATMQGMSVADVMKVADWTSDSTFKNFYYRPMEAPLKSLFTSLTRK